MSLERFIKFIKEGEPVSPGTPNRPLQQLDQNINYLWELIQAAELGSTVYARSQTVISTLKVGQPVYLNTATAQFEPAFAATDTDSATGYLVVPDQAQVWGIVAEKHNATLADILLFGYADIDISEAIGQLPGSSVAAGTWYLSGASAGQLTLQQPPVTIPVCKTDLNGGVFVNPSFVDFLENHRHYVFDLEMLPAGTVTPPPVGGTHVITAADSNDVGWLPADDAIFGGNAPAGAKFGYNLSQNDSLDGVYPPVPLQSASILMQRPSVWDTALERKWYGEQLMEDLVIIDRNGVWWMSDCYDAVPWPTDLDTSSSVSESYGVCDPGGKEYSLKLYYTRVGFATDNTVVRSIKSLDERLVITCADKTDPATTGDLDIDLDLTLMIGEQDVAGYIVFKGFDAATNTFSLGPVAEGVYATSSNVQLTSPDQTTDGSGNTVYHGPIGLGVLTQTTQELSSQLVRLDGVTEENFPVLYLGMPDDVAASYVVKFEVPSDAPASSTFTFRPRILGRAAGTLPQLTASYYKAGRPVDGLNTPLDITQSYVALTMVTVATLTGANQAVEASSDSFSVDPGDTVYVQLERTPEDVSDAYAGELGIMQQAGILTST
tara:strand:+ start:10517 stop:12334 length:1818 start_codon:yes stop_codon:yes gene_type:complete